ncbi:hypothetical protein BDV98DRAFT_594174 [Pterulicium gracile]|uniref:Uncharacterized protein n=1 Tax=Pterulicium gracile TaxID=1884261 RepID=A0A5C3QGL9_9AGAR|nr:hypothetical protein BDV98DRAFT_594174 [Pterula gracilis]
MIQGTPRLPGTDDAYKNKPPEYIPTFDQLALQVYCFLFEAKALLLRPSLWLTTRDKDKAQELLGAYDIVKRSASQAIRTLQAFPSNERVYVILTTGCHFCLFGAVGAEMPSIVGYTNIFRHALKLRRQELLNFHAGTTIFGAPRMDMFEVDEGVNFDDHLEHKAATKIFLEHARNPRPSERDNSTYSPSSTIRSSSVPEMLAIPTPALTTSTRTPTTPSADSFSPSAARARKRPRTQLNDGYAEFTPSLDGGRFDLRPSAGVDRGWRVADSEDAPGSMVVDDGSSEGEDKDETMRDSREDLSEDEFFFLAGRPSQHPPQSEGNFSEREELEEVEEEDEEVEVVVVVVEEGAAVADMHRDEDEVDDGDNDAEDDDDSSSEDELDCLPRPSIAASVRPNERFPVALKASILPSQLILHFVTPALRAQVNRPRSRLAFSPTASVSAAAGPSSSRRTMTNPTPVQSEHSADGTSEHFQTRESSPPPVQYGAITRSTAPSESPSLKLPKRSSKPRGVGRYTESPIPGPGQ